MKARRIGVQDGPEEERSFRGRRTTAKRVARAGPFESAHEAMLHALPAGAIFRRTGTL